MDVTVLAKLKWFAGSGVAALAAATALGAPAPALAAGYAVVVGIDAYTPPIPPLQGAVNDAKDIAQALTKVGTDVLLITDLDATKDRIRAGWVEQLGKAQAGDVIYFTYAGHGSQEPAKPNDPEEPDGLDENLPLVHYALEGPGLAERIVDNEIAEWIQEAAAKKVRVIMVTDACHSGTMHRSVSLATTYRKSPKPKINREELLQFAPPAPATSETVLPNAELTALAGVSDDKLVPEVQIEGKPRGALSWAFARAVEGAADADGDGATTEKELVAYVRSMVLQQSGNQQISQSSPPVSRDVVVLGKAGEKPAGSDDLASAIKLAEEAASSAPLMLAYRNGDGPEAVEGASITTDVEKADFVYDVTAGTVEKRVAGVVAEGVKPDGLAGIVAKWRAIAFLGAMATGGTTPFEVTSGPRTYKRGEKLTIALATTGRHYMTLFNLPPNGKVEFLYPATAQERDEDWTGKPFTLPLAVKDPPFGAEHLIAVLSDQPLDELHTALKALTTPIAAVVLPDTLKNALAGQKVTIGIGNIVTSSGD